jgi:hypothetical protein
MDELFALTAPLDWTLSAIQHCMSPFSGRRGLEIYEEQNLHKLW